MRSLGTNGTHMGRTTQQNTYNWASLAVLALSVACTAPASEQAVDSDTKDEVETVLNVSEQHILPAAEGLAVSIGLDWDSIVERHTAMMNAYEDGKIHVLSLEDSRTPGAYFNTFAYYRPGDNVTIIEENWEGTGEDFSEARAEEQRKRRAGMLFHEFFHNIRKGGSLTHSHEVKEFFPALKDLALMGSAALEHDDDAVAVEALWTGLEIVMDYIIEEEARIGERMVVEYGRNPEDMLDIYDVLLAETQDEWVERMKLGVNTDMQTEIWSIRADEVSVGIQKYPEMPAVFTAMGASDEAIDEALISLYTSRQEIVEAGRDYFIENYVEVQEADESVESDTEDAEGEESSNDSQEMKVLVGGESIQVATQEEARSAARRR